METRGGGGGGPESAVLGGSLGSVVVVPVVVGLLLGSKDQKNDEDGQMLVSSGGSAGASVGSSIPGEDVMMNHVILKHMFDECSPAQLNNFRRVCKEWYKISLPAWLGNGPAKKLKSLKELDSLVAQLSASSDTTGGSSSSDEHDAEGKENDTDDKGEIIASGIRQYRKFHLEFSPLPSYDLKQFLSKVGAQLTHLTLEYVIFLDRTVLAKFLRFKYTPNLEYLEVILIDQSGFGSTPRFPPPPADGGDDVKGGNFELKTLKIDYNYVGGAGFESRTKPFPLKWKEFLGQFPKLKVFEVGCYLSRQMDQVESILKAIKDIREKDKSKLELKSFIWSFNINWKIFETLESQPLPPAIYNLLRETGLLQVDSFRMDFSTEESEELIYGVMSLYAKSLRKLEIYRFSPFETSSSSSPFRDMSQLQSLTLSGFPLKNLDLLKTLPNLASLCLWGDLNRECPSYAKDLISSTKLSNEEGVVWAFPSLAKFSCNYVVSWTANDISQLQTLMPALSHLELALTDVTFRRVCQYWPRLEHLSMYGNGVGDEGIVGFTKRANSHYVTYSKPNITSLTYLKSFAIETNGVSSAFPEGSFTWHSVMHGFCELPNLKKLLIESAEGFGCQQYVLGVIPFANVKIGGRRFWYCKRSGQMFRE